MDWHIIGTFTSENEAVRVIRKLVEDEGYTPDELALVMDKHNEYEKKIDTFKEVQIDQVEVEEESVWEKIRETFSFNSYDSKASHSVLEEYGVSHEQSRHYMDALRDGEIILLAHTDAPSNTELSGLNEEILEEESENMNSENKNNKPVKEDVNPKKVEVAETDKEKLNDETDPSQADDTRKEKEKEAAAPRSNESSSNSMDTSSSEGEELKNNPDEDPDLTGQEKTVDAEDAKHGYGNKVAEGVVKPEAKSPLNTDEKNEKEPSEDTEAPDTDANYPEESEEAGMKSEQ